MKQILKTYGKFLLEGLAVALLAALIFTGITDADGNRGAFRIIGARIDADSTDYHAYQDFDGYSAESGKAAPEIRSSFTVLPSAGDTVCLNDCISAVDYAGNGLNIRINSITGPDGSDLTGSLDFTSMTIQVHQPGTYTVRVTAVDDGARKSMSMIKIPVNG